MGYKKIGRLGYWIVKNSGNKKNVSTSSTAMDEKLTQAFAKLKDSIIGCSYKFIAYIGTQIVDENIINHAILTRQVILSGKDTINIAIVKFIEKDGVFSLYGIEPLFENADILGGYKVYPKVGAEIPSEALEDLKEVTSGYVGVNIEPIALLASRITKGTEYIFACYATPTYPDAKSSVKLISVNALGNYIEIEDIL